MTEQQLMILCKRHYHEGNLAIAKAVEKAVRREVLDYLVNFSANSSLYEIETEITRMSNENT